jgi:hypothetical protein
VFPPPRTCPTTASWRADVRLMFVVYLVLIVTGLVLSSVIGLTHN